MNRFTLSILVFVLAACSAVPASELDRNRNTWTGQKISHYQFTLQIGCFCAFMDQMPLTVEVKDGQIISLTDAQGVQVLDTDPSYPLFSQYATIENLFEELESGLKGGADLVNVTYDEVLGYPVEIYFDYIEAAVDDELSVAVSNLIVLK